MARLGLLIPTLASVIGCSQPDQMEIRFASAAQREATTDLRVFLFGGPDAEAPGCPAVDPRGLGPGDAPARTGLTAAHEARGPLVELVAEIPQIPKGRYTVVLEAWGPACEEVRSGATESVCARLSADDPSVLRAYYCNDLELGARQLDAVADLESFADVGASMTVPTAFPANAKRYDASEPLLVADGRPARDRFMVQLLSGTSDELDDVKVRFQVEHGAGSLVDAQPRLTAQDPDIQDQGLAWSTLRADRFASGVDDSELEVSAYAPGFEGSPVRFFARAIRSVAVRIEDVSVPLTRAQLGNIDPNSHPVVLYDLDADGRLDVITVAGRSTHQVVVHYGGSDQVHVTDPQPRQARGLTVARLRTGLPSILVSVADQVASSNVTISEGTTPQIDNPGLEIYDDVSIPSAQGDLPGPTQVLSEIDGQPIRKVAIAMTARDLNDDGIDEVAAARCSYLFLADARQSRFVRCYGRIIDRTDSEIVLWASDGNGNLTRKATIAGSGNQGGFREVTFADVNADNSLDLVFASNSQVHAACGRRFQADVGFGFDGVVPFATTITFGAGYAVAAGHFDDDPLQDVVITGAVRASSTDSGIKVVGGANCDGFDPGPPPLVTGSKTGAHLLSARSADLNRDGRDDIVLLHRSTRTLQVFLGGGHRDFAAGPVIELPASVTGELALAREGDDIVAATVAAADNVIYRIRFSPEP